MKTVDRAFVEHLPGGAQLIEVLPEKEYAWGHLPGALNLPLKQLDELAPKLLDRDRLVVTYCNDYFCDLSPRAASWLEHHGFPHVADYAGGKQNWLAYGLPYEGEADLVARHVHPLISCTADERVGDVAARLNGSAPLAVVVEPDGVVLGLLDEKAFSQHADERAEDAASFGPSTVRPNEERAELDKRMAAKKLRRLLVTNPDGQLCGLYERAGE